MLLGTLSKALQYSYYYGICRTSFVHWWNHFIPEGHWAGQAGLVSPPSPPCALGSMTVPWLSQVHRWGWRLSHSQGPPFKPFKNGYKISLSPVTWAFTWLPWILECHGECVGNCISQFPQHSGMALTGCQRHRYIQVPQWSQTWSLLIVGTTLLPQSPSCHPASLRKKTNHESVTNQLAGHEAMWCRNGLAPSKWWQPWNPSEW